MKAARWSRRTIVVVIAAAALAQLVTATGYLATRPASPGRPSDRPIAGLTAIRALLEQRSRAVAAGDRTAFLATVDPAFRAQQDRLQANLAKLPLTGWRETLADDRPEPLPQGGWTSRLRVSYRLTGFDRSDVTRTAYLTFGHRPGRGWLITGAGHGKRDDPELWTGGELAVVRGRHSLVAGISDGGETVNARAVLQQIAVRLDAAVGVVSGVTGRQWDRKAVAVLPASQAEAGRMAGGKRDLEKIAALATARPDRIVISPHLYPRLNTLGRRVVLTHELTHVATGGARDTTTPIWLIEGLADYTGYQRVRVSVRSAARELAGEVRSGRVPSKLPGPGDFAVTSGRLAQSYEAAWLACRMVAGRYGEGALMRLYRAAGELGEDRALRRVIGMGVREFTAQWRSYLRRELG